MPGAAPGSASVLLDRKKCWPASELRPPTKAYDCPTRLLTVRPPPDPPLPTLGPAHLLHRATSASARLTRRAGRKAGNGGVGTSGGRSGTADRQTASAQPRPGRGSMGTHSCLIAKALASGWLSRGSHGHANRRRNHRHAPGISKLGSQRASCTIGARAGPSRARGSGRPAPGQIRTARKRPGAWRPRPGQV